MNKIQNTILRIINVFLPIKRFLQEKFFRGKIREIVLVKSHNKKISFYIVNCYETRGESMRNLISEAYENSLKKDFFIAINTGDKIKNLKCIKTFNFSTINEDYSFVIPDFIFDCWPQVGIDDYDKICNEVYKQGLNNADVSKIGWIGAVDQSKTRKELLNFSLKNQDICEVINIDWNRKNPGKLTSFKYLSLPEQVKRWKFLIDVEGVGYSGRLKILLFSNRPVFIIDRSYKEWFYPYMIPWVHYIPVRRDLSDLKDSFVKLNNNKELQKEMGENAARFAKKYLTRSSAINIVTDILNKLNSKQRKK